MDAINDLGSIALAIVSLSLVVTLVVNGPNTARVITAFTRAFANTVSAAKRALRTQGETYEQ